MTMQVGNDVAACSLPCGVIEWCGGVELCGDAAFFNMS